MNAVAWWTFAACALFLAGVWLVGMLAAMFVFLLAVSRLWGERRPVVLLGTAGGLCLFVWLVFVRVFGLTLPRGLLGDLLFV
jgi:putative tricarboxylic transport membrane protein